MQQLTCLGCDSLCDDLCLKNGTVVSLKQNRECPIAQKWFQASETNSNTDALQNGNSISKECAIREIALLLQNSVSPLITGLGNCSTKTIRSAVQLADRIGATIDPSTSRTEINSLQALTHHGSATCTLGEIKQRSNLLLFWNVEPEKTHPCLFDQLGIPISNQEQKTKKLIVITSQKADQENANYPWADHVITISKNGTTSKNETTNLFAQLTIALSNPSNTKTSSTNCSAEATFLAEQITKSKYPVLIHNNQISNASSSATWVAFSKLVSQANQSAQLHAVNIGEQGSFNTAESVLAWQTGFSRSVCFFQQFPQQRLEDCSTESMLANRETDLCLVIGGLPRAMATSSIWKQNPKMKLVIIGPASAHHPLNCEPAIRLFTAVDGFHNSGTFYRFDHVPIPARPIGKTNLPDLSLVLTQLNEQIKNSEADQKTSLA